MKQVQIAALIDEKTRTEFNLACALLNTTASDVIREAVEATIAKIRSMPRGSEILDAALAKVGEGET